MDPENSSGADDLSGFAAVIRFDGAPVDTRMLARMLDAIDYRGPDGRREWTNGQAAIGHLMLHTTAESLAETQPLANNEGSLVLAMDGWLANPVELRLELTARGAALRTDTDAELVLRAYETWGEDCPHHVDGEYAFLLWDERRRELVCMKDHAGTRPLHYHWDGRRLLVASDLAGVLAAGDFEPRPNRGMIAEHLASQWYSADETLWEGVMRLLPAHQLRAGATGPRLRRHWTPPSEVGVRYGSDKDYQAHYRELLQDCVRRASRSHRAIACEVSGGHDSSAIFSLADQLLNDGRLLAPDLTGYTYNFGSDADDYTHDLPYARAIGAFLGREIHEVRPFMPELQWFAQRGRADLDLPPYPNAAMAVAIGRALTGGGSRVALSGEGGDEFIGSHYPFYYAEHLLERDWSALASSLQDDAAAFGTGRTMRMFYQFGIGAVMPPAVREMRRRFRRSPAQISPGRGLLSAELQNLLDERGRRAGRLNSATVRNPGARSLRMTLESGITTYARDFISRNSARLGYEARSPLYSRNMLEFAFSVPERQRRRGAINKHMHLGALANDLPPQVLARTSKATFNLAFVRQLDKAREAMILTVLQSGIDWLEPEGVRELYRKYDREPTGTKPIYGLWAAFGCLNLFSDCKRPC